MRVLVGGHADLQRLDLGDHALAERVGRLLADRNGDGQGHAALARRSEGGAGEVLDHLVHVGVRQDDAVVLGPAHRLDALTDARAFHVDVVGDVGGADEAHRLDVGMG